MRTVKLLEEKELQIWPWTEKQRREKRNRDNGVSGHALVEERTISVSGSSAVEKSHFLPFPEMHLSRFYNTSAL